MLEYVVDKNHLMYLERDLEFDDKENEIEDLIENLNNISINFATIDLGIMSLREFNATFLANLLSKLKIPYFTIQLPSYVKGHYSKDILEINNKYKELKATYNTLENKNTPGAEELKFLMYHYSKELMELKRYIKKIRTEAISNKILDIIKGHEDNLWTFIHFGEENTFLEIMTQVKEQNVKSNVIFIPKSKFL